MRLKRTKSGWIAAGAAVVLLSLALFVARAGIDRPGGARSTSAVSAEAGSADSLAGAMESCVPCHMNPGMRMGYRDEGGKVHQLFIDPEGFRRSIHYRNGKKTCGDCHEGDYGTFPHASRKLPACLDCHREIREEYLAIDRMARAGVHFREDMAGFDCATCHSPHGMVPSREMSVARKNRACIECHEGPSDPSGLSLARRHDWHPQAALHLDRIACISCHTKPEGEDFSFRHRILPKEQATSDCYACHTLDSKMAYYIGSFGEKQPRTLGRLALVRDYYISGSTRFPLLDVGGLSLMALVFLGIAGHGLLRLRGAKRRGREG